MPLLISFYVGIDTKMNTVVLDDSLCTAWNKHFSTAFCFNYQKKKKQNKKGTLVEQIHVAIVLITTRDNII